MRTTKRWPVRSAFTLIELVTVIVVLGVVAAAAVGPTLTSIASIHSQAATSRLLTDIRYMQRTALYSGLRTWIVFSVASNNYQLYMENPASPGKAGRLAAVHPSDQSSSAVQFGAGAFANVSISSVNINSTSELEFDSFGVPYDGGGAALTTAGVITLSTGVTVTVHPAGGFVERS